MVYFLIFSRNFNPTPTPELTGGVIWEPVAPGVKQEYLNITSEPLLKMEYDPGYKARVDFWQHVWHEVEVARPREFLSQKPPLLANELPPRNSKKESSIKAEL